MSERNSGNRKRRGYMQLIRHERAGNLNSIGISDFRRGKRHSLVSTVFSKKAFVFVSDVIYS